VHGPFLPFLNLVKTQFLHIEFMCDRQSMPILLALAKTMFIVYGHSLQNSITSKPKIKNQRHMYVSKLELPRF